MDLQKLEAALRSLHSTLGQLLDDVKPTVDLKQADLFAMGEDLPKLDCQRCGRRMWRKKDYKAPRMDAMFRGRSVRHEEMVCVDCGIEALLLDRKPGAP